MASLPSVAIVGPGRAGCALARALRRSGCRLTGLVARSRGSAARASRRLGARLGTTDLDRAAGAAGVVLLCVPDAALPAAVAALGRLPLEGKTVLHVSGALDLSTLAPLRARGASVGSLHPLLSFPGPGGPPVSLAGASLALSGDPRALHDARRLARALGGVPIRVPPHARAAYHAAATLAAGGLVALLDAVLEIAVGRLRWPPARARAAFLTLARSALAQVEQAGTRAALTGPVARGDLETVRRHLAALAREGPEVLAIYRLLGRRALAMSAGPRREPSGGARRRLRRLLGRPLRRRPAD